MTIPTISLLEIPFGTALRVNGTELFATPSLPPDAATISVEALEGSVLEGEDSYLIVALSPIRTKPSGILNELPPDIPITIREWGTQPPGTRTAYLLESLEVVCRDWNDLLYEGTLVRTEEGLVIEDSEGVQIGTFQPRGGHSPLMPPNPPYFTLDRSYSTSGRSAGHFIPADGSPASEAELEYRIAKTWTLQTGRLSLRAQR